MEKSLKLVDTNNIYSGSDPMITLTLSLSLTLGLGLRLTPGKTVSIENPKQNAKDEHRRKVLG